jgi:hypothetical protein
VCTPVVTTRLVVRTTVPTSDRKFQCIDQNVEVPQCTHNNYPGDINSDQICDQRPGVAINSSGPVLKLSFTASPNHCSDIIVGASVDEFATGFGGRVSPGQTVTGQVSGLRGDNHYVSLMATGVEGGCNHGTLDSWAGNVRIETEGT